MTQESYLVEELYNKVASFKAAEYFVSASDLSCFALVLYQFACRGVSHGFPTFFDKKKEELILIRLDVACNTRD